MKAKVLLSVDQRDLEEIDRRAESLGLTRSAYVVAAATAPLEKEAIKASAKLKELRAVLAR